MRQNETRCMRGSMWAMALVSIVVGVTSHGWNGVYFSEVARFAPAGGVADAAAGAQVANLVGVATGPLVFVAVALLAGERSAFLVLAAPMALCGLLLLRRLGVGPADGGSA